MPMMIALKAATPQLPRTTAVADHVVAVDETDSTNALVGGVVVVYAFGFVIQSALTGAPLAAVALASMGFVVGDAIKAVVASLAAAGLSKLGR